MKIVSIKKFGETTVVEYSGNGLPTDAEVEEFKRLNNLDNKGESK